MSGIVSIRSREAVVALFLFGWTALSAQSGFARPQYFARYRAYPFARPDLKTCAVCHENPKGGGPRNEFGQAFSRAGRQFTSELRAQFPDRFLQDRAVLGGGVEILFDPAEPGSIIVKKGDTSYKVTPANKDVVKMATAASTEAVAAPVDGGGSPLFDTQIVNLRSGKVVPKGEFYFRFTHRFTTAIFNQARREFDLFGLDSYNYPGIGVGYGITNRLAVNIFRDRGLGFGISNRDLEFSGEFALFEQGESRSPVSVLARAAVHGKNDFASQAHDGHYIPSLQLVLQRTFRDRFSLNVNPTFVFNLRASDSQAVDGRLAAIGLGGSLRIRQNLAIVGEFIPRVTGRPFGQNFVYVEPTASFGLQYRTYRHVFELVFTNAWQTTIAGSVLGGPDQKHIGFNLYRRIR